MRSFKTTDEQQIDLQINSEGKVFLVIDGKCHSFEPSDAQRIAANLSEAAKAGAYRKESGNQAITPFE